MGLGASQAKQMSWGVLTLAPTLAANTQCLCLPPLQAPYLHLELPSSQAVGLLGTEGDGHLKGRSIFFTIKNVNTQCQFKAL